MDWFMKMDPSMWKANDFECMNVPMRTTESTNEKLFVNKPKAKNYIKAKNLYYDNL